MITTTLNRIRANRPCESSWRALLTKLGKTKADDEPLSYADILAHCGLQDALWALRCEPQHDSLWRHMACDFADTVRHLMTHANSHKAIAVARLYADGYATDAQRAAARAAAWGIFLHRVNGDTPIYAWGSGVCIDWRVAA